ncbi:hypothetical protein HY251_06285 [bacterium]|nr:hypothetical protein [bacterium]
MTGRLTAGDAGIGDEFELDLQLPWGDFEDPFRHYKTRSRFLERAGRHELKALISYQVGRGHSSTPEYPYRDETVLVESDTVEFEVVDPLPADKAAFEEIVASNLFGHNRALKHLDHRVYKRFIERFPNSVYAPYLTWEYLGEDRVGVEIPDDRDVDAEDEAALNKILAEHPDFVYADRVLAELVRLMLCDHDTSKAASYLSRLESAYPGSVALEKARFAIRQYDSEHRR